jgi:lysophospholipase L1-like esterase
MPRLRPLRKKIRHSTGGGARNSLASSSRRVTIPPVKIALILISVLATAAPLLRADTGPPAKDKPWVPAHGFYSKAPEAWEKLHAANLERARKGGVDVLFYGDSITEGWREAGRSVWDERIAPFQAANFGISGDSTRQLLYRMEHGEVDGLRPKVVVLMVGTNNLYNDFNAGTDREVVKGIRAVVSQLRKRLPESRILLLGVLPRENKYYGQRIANVNAALREFDDGGKLRFLDLTPHFQSAPGQLIDDLYEPDTVHLREAGYKVWADEMLGLLGTMLRE